MTVLAFDGGGSVTRAGLYDDDRQLVAEAHGGPTNPVAYGPEAAAAILRALGRRLITGDSAPPAIIAAALSGAGDQHAHEIIANALFHTFHPQRVILSGDAQPVLLANAGDSPAVLVISGTGACVVGQAHGNRIIVGGRGALFGEEGGAYGLARSALRCAAMAVDELGPTTALVDALTQAVGVDNFSRICRWGDRASKRDVAALAQAVLHCANNGDGVALTILAQHATSLARQTAHALRKINANESATVFIQGGLIENSSPFRQMYEKALTTTIPSVTIAVPPIRGHEAAAHAAWRETLPSDAFAVFHSPPDSENSGTPSTEDRARETVPIDNLGAGEIVSRMIDADEGLAEILGAQAANIATAVEWAAGAIRSNRRLIYIGAGTSGRLGVLDASECPPTFGVHSDTVVGIIAGGDKALRESVEGAEDDEGQGRADIALAQPGDLVIGVAASGMTPYTRAALDEAAKRDARTVLLCCNPAITGGAECVIALDTGPEVVAGSTRLRAGTATKMVLNIISTAAFTLSGYVYDGYMVGVTPVNNKLRRRAVRIVAAITGCETQHAQACLDEAGYHVKTAIVMAALDVKADRAREILDNIGGNLHAVLKKEAPRDM